ncbi:MAG: hypothetical protein V4609_19525 [Pseudomonadota bacterium]
MLIESSLPGAVASRSRSSSQDEGQPAQLPRPPAAQPALEVVEHTPPTLQDVRIVVRPQTPEAGDTPEVAQPGGARELSAPVSTPEAAQRSEAPRPVAHGQPQPRESLGTRLCNGAGEACSCLCLSPIIIVAATVGSLMECVGYLCDYPRNDHFMTWGDVYHGIRDWAREV